MAYCLVRYSVFMSRFRLGVSIVRVQPTPAFTSSLQTTSTYSDLALVLIISPYIMQYSLSASKSLCQVLVASATERIRFILHANLRRAPRGLFVLFLLVFPWLILYLIMDISISTDALASRDLSFFLLLGDAARLIDPHPNLRSCLCFSSPPPVRF